MEKNSTTIFIVIIMILIILIMVFTGINIIKEREEKQKIIENQLLSDDYMIQNQINQNNKKISLEDKIKNKIAKGSLYELYIIQAIAIMLFIIRILIILFIIRIIPFWIIYSKNNQPGWAILIPIYNKVVLYRIVKIQTSYAFYGLIPVIGQIISTVMFWYAMYLLVKKYNKGIGYFLGLIFLPIIFLYILAFSTVTDNNKMFFDRELRDDEIP